MSKITYAIYDCREDQTLCLITVPESLGEQIIGLQAKNRSYLEVCTSHKGSGSYNEYRLVPGHARMEKIILRIRECLDLLAPRHRAIDKCLDEISTLTAVPSEYEVCGWWEFLVIIENCLHKNPSDWIRALAAEPETLTYMRKVVEELEKRDHRGYIEEEEYLEVTNDSYLLRYDKVDSDEWLVVMGDFGITWEPARVYTTPCYGRIGGDDPESDALILSTSLIALAKVRLMGRAAKPTETS